MELWWKERYKLSFAFLSNHECRFSARRSNICTHRRWLHPPEGLLSNACTGVPPRSAASVVSSFRGLFASSALTSTLFKWGPSTADALLTLSNFDKNISPEFRCLFHLNCVYVSRLVPFLLTDVSACMMHMCAALICLPYLPWALIFSCLIKRVLPLHLVLAQCHWVDNLIWVMADSQQ